MPSKGTFDVGTCDTVTLTAKAEGAIDPGSYTGVLVASAPGTAIARRRVVITGPAAVPKPVGAVATAPLRGTRQLPRRSRVAEGGRDHRAQAPRRGRDARGWGRTARGRSPGRSGRSEKCPFVGALFKGTDIAQVYVAGEPKLETKGAALLPVRVTGADHAGAYEGKLDLAESGEDADAVSVKLTVKDAWWCAIGALLLGLIPALLLQLWPKRWRPEKELRRRCGELAGEYSQAGEAFSGITPPPSKTTVNKYVQPITESISTYADSVLLWDTTSEAYKELDASIELAENDAHYFGAGDGFAKDMRALRQQLEKLTTLLNRSYPIPGSVGIRTRRRSCSRAVSSRSARRRPEARARRGVHRAHQGVARARQTRERFGGLVVPARTGRADGSDRPRCPDPERRGVQAARDSTRTAGCHQRRGPQAAGYQTRRRPRLRPAGPTGHQVRALARRRRAGASGP